MLSKENFTERLQSMAPFTELEYLYYHLEGIENFIYHLDSIKAKRKRKRAEARIDKFLVLLEQRRTEGVNVEDLSKELFPYFGDIQTIYVEEVGFTMKLFYPLF